MSITISREGENDETLAKRALRRTLATVKPDIGSLSAVLNFSCAPPLYPHQLAGMDVANPCRSPTPHGTTARLGLQGSPTRTTGIASTLVSENIGATWPAIPSRQTPR